MRSSSLILFSYKIMHKRLFEAETLVPAVKPPSTFREPTHRRPERAKRKGAAPLPPRPECKGAALCRPGRNARFRPSVILSEANAVSAVEGSRAAPAESASGCRRAGSSGSGGSRRSSLCDASLRSLRVRIEGRSASPPAKEPTRKRARSARVRKELRIPSFPASRPLTCDTLRTNGIRGAFARSRDLQREGWNG